MVSLINTLCGKNISSSHEQSPHGRRGRRRRQADRCHSAAAEVLEVRETLSATVVSTDGRATLVVDESRREITIRFANLNRTGSPQTQFDVPASATGQWTVKFDDLLNTEKTTVWFRGRQQVERDTSQRFPSVSVSIALPEEISARVTGSNGTTLMQPVMRLRAPVNRTPADITLSGSTVTENSPAGTVVGTLSAQDPDRGDTHTFVLLDDAGGRFRAVGSQIQVANGAMLDYEAARSHTIRVRATDRGGLSVERALTITVTNLNEAPTDIRLSSQTVAEGAAIGTEVGILNAVDPDETDRWRFQLLDDADGRFALNGNRLYVADSVGLDYELSRSHRLRVEVRDAAGASCVRDLMIDLTDIADTHLQTVISADQRARLQVNHRDKVITIHFRNYGDVASPEVQFDLSGLSGSKWTVAFDDLLDSNKTTVWRKNGQEIGRDTRRSPSQTTSLPMNGQISGVITGRRGNVLMRAVMQFKSPNSPPADIVLSGNSVKEHASVGTLIGTVAVVDPDAEDSFTIELVDDADGRFLLDGNRLLVADAARLDYEVGGAHVVRLRATDGSGAAVERALTVNVTDIADSHLQALPSRDGRSVALIDWSTRTVTLHYVNFAAIGREDVHFDFDLKDSTAAGWTLRYDDLLNTTKIVTWAKDGEVIGVDKNQRSPTKVTSLTHGSRISGQVNGALGKVLMRAVVHIVNHAPTSIQLSHNTVPEHYPSGAAVGRLTVTDQDAGDRHNLTLVDDAGGRFRLQGDRIFVADAAGLDFETSPSYRISVRATDLRGETRDETFTITLVDIDDRFMEVVASRDGRARLLIDHHTQTVTIHYLNADAIGSPEIVFDVASLSSSGWTFQFDDLINNRKTVTWYRNGTQLREVKSERFPQIKTVPDAGGRLSAVIQGEAGRKLMHAVLNFTKVQEVRRDPVIVVMTHGWTSWLEDTPSDWIPQMARAMAAMTNRLGIDELDPNVKPVRLDAIENASGQDELLKLWKGSPQFLALNWTQQSNNGTAAVWDINEVTHRRSMERSAKALLRMIRARVNEYTANDADVKVDLLIVGHSFGTSVNRDLVDLLEGSDFVDKLDLTKVVELDPVALKAKNASTHDKYFWRHPELSPVVDRVTSYYQTKGVLADFLDRQLLTGRPLDGYGADAGDTERSGGAPLGFFNSQGRVFSAGTGTELQRFRHHRPNGSLSTGELTAVDYSLNGQYLASASRDGSVEIRDAVSLQVISSLRGHRGDIRDAAFSPDGKLVATVGQDDTVRIWRTVDGNEVWRGQHAGVTEVAWNSTGTQFAAAGNDGRIKVFGAAASAPGSFQQLAVAVVPNGQAIRGLAFAGEQLITGGLDGSLRVWNLSTPGLVQSQRIRFDRDIRGLVVTQDGTLCAVATGRGVSLLSRQPGGGYALKQETTLHQGRVQALAMSSDGQFLASGGDDGRILVYDLESLRLEREISTPMLPLRELDFNGDGNEIAAVFQNQEGGPVNDINVTENLESRIDPSFWETFKKWFDRGVDLLKDVFDGDGYWDVAFDVVKIAAQEYVEEAKTRVKYHVTVPFVYIDDVLKKNGEPFFSLRDNPGVLRYNDFVARPMRLEDEPPVVALSLDLPADSNGQTGSGSSLVEMKLSEPVTGFDQTDFQLLRDGATVDLTGTRLEKLSETHFRLDLSAATNQPGFYLLTLSASSSGIADSAGNPLSADCSLQFQVTAPPVLPEPGQSSLSAQHGATSQSIGMLTSASAFSRMATSAAAAATTATPVIPAASGGVAQNPTAVKPNSQAVQDSSGPVDAAALLGAGLTSRPPLIVTRPRQQTTRYAARSRSVIQPVSPSGGDAVRSTAHSPTAQAQLSSLARPEVTVQIDAVFASWDGV